MNLDTSVQVGANELHDTPISISPVPQHPLSISSKPTCIQQQISKDLVTHLMRLMSAEDLRVINLITVSIGISDHL